MDIEVNLDDTPELEAALPGECLNVTVTADASLGIVGASVGQIARITAVDPEGKPEAWEPVDMPDGLVAPYAEKSIDNREYTGITKHVSGDKSYAYSRNEIISSTWANFRSKGLIPGQPWKAVIITDAIPGTNDVIPGNCPYFAQLITDPYMSSWTYRITDSKGSTYLYEVMVSPNSWNITKETYTKESEVACVTVSAIPDTYKTPLLRYNMNFYLWRDDGSVPF